MISVELMVLHCAILEASVSVLSYFEPISVERTRMFASFAY